MTNPVPVLSDDAVAEIAAMFPHAEYQPTLSPEEVDPCEFCKGTIDDHKANCVVPHVHSLCATVRALRGEVDARTRLHSDDEMLLAQRWDHIQTLEAENTALREQLAQQQEALISCDSVLTYIYHRERSRLLPETQQQLLETTGKVEKLTRRKP